VRLQALSSLLPPFQFTNSTANSEAWRLNVAPATVILGGDEDAEATLLHPWPELGANAG